ncbi:MAG: cobalamin-dependent protein [Deltaproteobacteria bacterium]|nr:cobalamin-dependent protein [Candidatus Anaeroferrophillacea bacterium]
MAHLVLLNSIAARRRSISDTFFDNGIGTLKGYLEERGHGVRVIDWARDDSFQELSPLWLARPLRGLYGTLMGMNDGAARKVLGAITLPLQGLLSRIQEKRLNRRMDALVDELAVAGTRVIGIKVWYGEAFQNTSTMLERIRRRLPEVLTLVGGYHVTLYEERLMAACAADFGIVREGEYALAAVLDIVDRHADNWRKAEVVKEITAAGVAGEIENLIYRRDGKPVKTAVRELSGHCHKSVPRYDDTPGKVGIHVVVDSLGCDWGKCSFCVHSHFYPRYITREVGEIVAEIAAMRRQGIGVFRFAGSDTPPTFGARIGKAIIDAGQPVVFGMGSRAIRGAEKRVDKLVELYATMLDAGLRAVFIGGECGNDFINEAVMNKGVTAADVIATFSAIRRAEAATGKKVFISLALIYPPPLLGRVTLDEVEVDNLTLLRATRPDSVMITPPGPFLHTAWYNRREHYGFKLKEDVITQAMNYEYVLYKPPHLWPPLDVSLDGRSFPELLAVCNDFRRRVERELEIPTDLSDEHFLMFYCAGVRTPAAVREHKLQTMLDIVSCDYSRTTALGVRVNRFSARLAAAPAETAVDDLETG